MEEENTKIELMQTLSRTFAVGVAGLSSAMRKSCGAAIAGQLLRSGTSIGANIAEGRYATTLGDRFAKLSIALKEAGETLYWVEFCEDTGVVQRSRGSFGQLHATCLQIIDLLDEEIDSLREKKAVLEAEGKKRKRRKKARSAAATKKRAATKRVTKRAKAQSAE